MVPVVKRFRRHRFLHRFAFLLIAAQLLSSPPVASAVAAIASASDGAHCAEMLEACPCCLDADMGVAACLSACTGAVGVFATSCLAEVRSEYALAEPSPLKHRADLADPPVKPPPIV